MYNSILDIEKSDTPGKMSKEVMRLNAPKDNNTQKHSNIFITVVLVAGIILVAAALSAGTLTFLANQKKETKNYTASFLASEVVTKMGYENLSEIKGSSIGKYYEIPDGIITDSSMFVSTRSDSFTEIACFKLADKSSQEQLTQIIDSYISAKTKNYQNVNETAYAAVSASKTDIHYPYVLVAISTDSEAAVKAFENIFNSTSK